MARVEPESTRSRYNNADGTPRSLHLLNAPDQHERTRFDMADKTLPTQAELHAILNYDPETGILTWKVNRGGMVPGDVAGKPVQGYCVIKFKGVCYAAHRLIWCHVYGEWPDKHIDHINRVRDDNRISNLRLATRSQNGFNIPTRASSVSGRTGVYWSKGTGRWIAAIRVNRKKIHLGSFRDLESAYRAREEAENIYVGDFTPKGGPW